MGRSVPGERCGQYRKRTAALGCHRLGGTALSADRWYSWLYWPGISNQYVGGDKCVIESPNLIRRLTPLECERLQGFPDCWTDIPGASDSARYKALGNSVAIPCAGYVVNGMATIFRMTPYPDQENQIAWPVSTNKQSKSSAFHWKLHEFTQNQCWQCTTHGI